MDSGIVTGAFALGGVVIGGGLDWIRGSLAARRVAAAERDKLFAALVAACGRVQTAAIAWRSLEKPSAKLRQAVYGLMESEARRPFTASDNMTAVARQLMSSAAVNGLKHLFPVGVADKVTGELMPMMSEIAVLSVKLSMTGDEGIQDACTRLSDATGALLGGLAKRDREFAKLQQEMYGALGQMRRARDAAAARRWRRRRGRRKGAATAGED